MDKTFNNLKYAEDSLQGKRNTYTESVGMRQMFKQMEMTGK